jgi:septum formation inhibitor MinC
MLLKQYERAHLNFEQALDKLDNTHLTVLEALCKRISKDREHLINKFIDYCHQYEQVLIQDQIDATDPNFKDVLEPLTLEDIVSLVGSKDINARSMGAMIFVDYALSRSDATFIEELVQSGGIDDILRSIQWNGDERHLIEELKFFATKALADLCWAPNHFPLRLHIVENENVPVENLIDRLIEQISNSSDSDLIGVSVSALALLGRGGISGIDHMICIDRIGLRAFTPLLQKCSHNPRDKNCLYVCQALAWLSSSDADIKLEMIKNKVMLESLIRLIKQQWDTNVLSLSLIILGNICQNPEIWGKPSLYDEMSQIVGDLTDGNYGVLMIDYLVNYLTNENLEIQYNAIVTLTQMLGFRHARHRFDQLGGEMVLFDLVSVPYAAIREQASKSIRFYRTLQDYGDRMGDILLPKFRLNHTQQQQLQNHQSQSPPQSQQQSTPPRPKKKKKEASIDDLLATLQTKKKKKKKVKQKKTQDVIVQTPPSPPSPPSPPPQPDHINENTDMYRVFINEFEKGMTNLANHLSWGE